MPHYNAAKATFIQFLPQFNAAKVQPAQFDPHPVTA
jgi:hypothetical protein